MLDFSRSAQGQHEVSNLCCRRSSVRHDTVFNWTLDICVMSYFTLLLEFFIGHRFYRCRASINLHWTSTSEMSNFIEIQIFRHSSCECRTLTSSADVGFFSAQGQHQASNFCAVDVVLYATIQSSIGHLCNVTFHASSRTLYWTSIL